MKTIKNIALIITSAIASASCASANRVNNENRQLKADIMKLLSEMDEDGTIEKYDGSDHVCRLFGLFQTSERRVEK